MIRGPDGSSADERTGKSGSPCAANGPSGSKHHDKHAAPLYASVPIQPTFPQRRRMDRRAGHQHSITSTPWPLHQNPLLQGKMPPPSNPHDNEKQAAAQQAVDILHEISTILVGSPAAHPPTPGLWGRGWLTRLPELPSRPENAVVLHLHD